MTQLQWQASTRSFGARMDQSFAIKAINLSPNTDSTIDGWIFIGNSCNPSYPENIATSPYFFTHWR